MDDMTLKSVFLSASVPVPGRSYFDTADPFLIQVAVRELAIALQGKLRLVWGGHPAITPMLWRVFEDLGQPYADHVTLYQSRYFEESFPEENTHFNNVVFTDKVQGDQEASLKALRQAMLSRSDLIGAVFIGGMEGVIHEFDLFRQFHPRTPVIALGAPGAAARTLLDRSEERWPAAVRTTVDFADCLGKYVDVILERATSVAEQEPPVALPRADERTDRNK